MALEDFRPTPLVIPRGLTPPTARVYEASCDGLPSDQREYILSRIVGGKAALRGFIGGWTNRSICERSGRRPFGTTQPQRRRCIVPFCVPIPSHWLSAAGQSYPSTHAAVITSTPAQLTAYKGSVTNGQRILLSAQRGVGPYLVMCLGLRSGDTLSLAWKRQNTWYTSDGTETTMETMTFTGDDDNLIQEDQTTAATVPADTRCDPGFSSATWALAIDVTYSGSTPNPWIIIIDEAAHLLGHGFICPKALPSGYTQRDQTDTDHGGYCRPTYPSTQYIDTDTGNREFAHHNGQAFLVADDTASPTVWSDDVYPRVWVDDRTLQLHRWRPAAFGCYGVVQTADVYLGEDEELYSGITITGPGWDRIRAWSWFLVDGDGTITLEWRRTSTWGTTGDPATDAVTVVDSQTVVPDAYASPEPAGEITDVEDLMPPDFTPQATIYLFIRRSGGTAFTAAEIRTQVISSPRTDIPPPWSVVDPLTDLQVVGGIIEDQLEDPPERGPLYEPAAGTLSQSVSGRWICRFLPTVAGIYERTAGSGSIAGDYDRHEGNASFLVGLLRRANTSLWCYGQSTGTFTVAKKTITPRSYTSAEVVDSSYFTGSRYAFYSFAYASTGVVRITLALANNHLLYVGGARIVAGSDVECISILRHAAFPARYLATFNGRQTTPPGSPSAGNQYVVAPGGTDAWEGHDEQVARWAKEPWESAGRWVFRDAVLGECTSHAAGNYWFDGSVWRGTETPVIDLSIAVTGSGTLYLRLEAFDDGELPVQASGGTLTIAHTPAA
jgi:hypothetical protein